jgi:hypothetical protein
VVTNLSYKASKLLLNILKDNGYVENKIKSTKEFNYVIIESITKKIYYLSDRPSLVLVGDNIKEFLERDLKIFLPDDYFNLANLNEIIPIKNPSDSIELTPTPIKTPITPIKNPSDSIEPTPAPIKNLS